MIRLVQLDAKLALRTLSGLFGDRGARMQLLILGAILVLMHAVAGYAVIRFAPDESTPDGAVRALVVARSATLLLLPWTIAAAMTTVTRWLYQRGDLDLLLSSPLTPRRLVAARILGQAFESVAALALILLPIAHASAFFGRPHWLAIYPALAAAGLIGAGVGFLLALQLFFVFGARRARLVAQIVATLVGASAVIAAQVLTLLPESWRDAVYQAFAARAGEGDWLGRLAEIPERAAMGDFPALVAWLGLGVAICAIAVLLRGEDFVTATVESAGAAPEKRRVDARAAFTSNLRAALRIKEHRLLWRDPWLLSQMLMQALYTAPVGIVLWRQGGAIGQPGVAFGPMLVVIAGQFSGALAWLALSAEDAPDTLRTAPTTRGEIEWAKLRAILQPVALTLMPGIAALAWLSPWGAICAGVGAAGSACTGALLMLWRQAPAKRGMVLRRHSQSKLLALGEHWLSLMWASVDALAAFGSPSFILPLALIGVTIWLIRPAAPTAPAAARPAAA